MKFWKLSVLIQSVLLSCSCVFAQQAQQAQQTRQAVLSYFGAQIGNELDTSATSCYIGTAGTLVTDGVNDYILSNSHVLAREGAGVAGENIMHTVSTYCSGNALHVGELAADIPLNFGRTSTNLVDAAIARITPDVVPATDTSNRVLHIGTGFSDTYGVSNNPVSTVGTAVKKSGRTTGLTRSSISLIGVNVVVRYSGGRAYFTNQFVVSGAGFSQGGDSGSLIVTDNSAANPVGLLFAGSSSDTIGNPIHAVLSEFQRVHSLSLAFRTSGDDGVTELTPPPGGGGGGNGGNGEKPGNGNGNGRTKSAQTPGLSGIAQALAVRDRNEARFLDHDGILGSGIGLKNGIPSITVFVNRDNNRAAGSIPSSIEGVKVNIVLTDEFVAF